jgi:hypothetical protein
MDWVLIIWGVGQTRALRSTDFEEYNVLTHMEYIAAAFGKGIQFDALKAQREQALPEHPAEINFGLPNFRQLVEAPVNLDPQTLSL